MTHFPRLAILSLTAAVLVAAAACGAEPITSPPARSPSAAPSAGSPTTPTPEADLAAPGTRLQSLQWDGVQRTYVVHAPPQYREGQRFPLVLVLHYLGGSGEKMRLMTKFDAKADQEGFLVVYVNGISSALNGLSCCGSSDDVGFVKALTDHMRRFWNADPNRIYATGISNGADMSFRLAVELSGTFAAIAPISGGYIGTRAEEEENLIPTSPVSVISIIGRLDGGIARFERGLATWKRRLACTEKNLDAPAPGVALTSARCADGSDVAVYIVDDLGHAWPGGVESERMGDGDAPVSATDLMWTFFEAHPRQG